MWCTRWFLPLLLLPLPIASPYFLFLFFFSLTLHARPCFYCIILLTALFTSSCYWQPVPTRALLNTSFSNVSREAPLWYHSNASLSDGGAISASQLLPMPRLTRLLDRCWCDLSAGHLFDPYNSTLWQLTSLSHALGAGESQSVLIAQETDKPSGSKNTGLASGAAEVRNMARFWVLKTTEKDVPRLEDEAGDVPSASANTSFARWLPIAVPFSLPSIPWLFNLGRHPLSDPLSATPLTASEEMANGTAEIKMPLLRRRYDLRPHGINLVVDFGWGRSHD